MVPATDNQAVVVSVLVIVSEFIHAHILGTIGVVLHSLAKKSNEFQEQIEFATSTMKTMRLGEKVQHGVLDYLTRQHYENESLKDLDSLM